MKKYAIFLLFAFGLTSLALGADNVVVTNVYPVTTNGGKAAIMRAHDNGDGTWTWAVCNPDGTAIGGGGGGGGGAVTLADGASVTLGAKADSAATSDTGTFSQIALTKRQLQTLASINTYLASGATAANQATGNTSVGNLDTAHGAKADSAATSDTGTFSIIALLKRGLQSLTSLVTNTTPPTTTAYRNTALSSTPQQVKGSAGIVYGWNFINTNTAAVYVKFYDALSGSVTVGTTTPLTIKMVPAGNGTTPGIFYLPKSQVPHGGFATGITIAAVTGIADSSTAAPTTGIYSEIGYQ